MNQEAMIAAMKVFQRTVPERATSELKKEIAMS